MCDSYKEYIELQKDYTTKEIEVVEERIIFLKEELDKEIAYKISLSESLDLLTAK